MPPSTTQIMEMTKNYILEGGPAHQQITPEILGTETWKYQYGKSAGMTAPELGIHYCLDTNGGRVMITTDGGTSKVSGYCLWVIVADHSVHSHRTGTSSAHNSQLNSLRPDLEAYLAEFTFLNKYVNFHNTYFLVAVRHIVDNTILVGHLTSYKRTETKKTTTIVRSDIDVQLQLENQLDLMYKAHHTMITTLYVTGHQDRGMGPHT